MTSPGDGQHSNVPIFLFVTIYIIVACLFLYFAYWLFPLNLSSPTTLDLIKEFGARAAVAATMAGALIGVVVSLYTLRRQIEASRSLETLRGEIVRHNDFLKAALENKTDAYNAITEAATSCYYELQSLAKGEYDKTSVEEEWKKLRQARGLVAHLEKNQREIVLSVMQYVINIKNSANKVKRSWGKDGSEDYKRIWTTHVKDFGKAMHDLQNASPFFNTRVGPHNNS